MFSFFKTAKDNFIMETLAQIIKSMAKGLIDSLKGTVAIFYLDKCIKEKEERSPLRNESLKTQIIDSKKSKQPQKHKQEGKVLKRALQCCGLNGGVFWLSIILFEYGLLPIMKHLLQLVFGNSSMIGNSAWAITESFLTVVFSTLWILPLMILSKVVNSLWFQDIADSAFRYSQGRPQVFSNFGKLIADTTFSIIIQAGFLFQTVLVGYFPVAPIGYVFSLIHNCMLFSLYSFEYRFYNMGWELHKRLNFIETNWPYFIGFGLPLSVLTSLTTSYIISGCIFSILFPLFIISASSATPITTNVGFKMQLFAPVISLSNAVLQRTMSTPLPVPEKIQTIKSNNR